MAEKAMVDAVCAKTDNVVVVLNVGGMIDTSWIIDNPRIKGALLAWQEGGTGAAFAPLFGYHALSVGAGQAAVCLLLGVPLLRLLEQKK